MRFLITLLLPALIAAPAFAKSKAKPAAKAKAKVEAPRLKSAFTGKLLTYNELVRLPKAKRMTYMKRMVDLLSTMITPQNPAVLVRDFKTDKTYIITRSDVIQALS